MAAISEEFEEEEVRIDVALRTHAKLPPTLGVLARASKVYGYIAEERGDMKAESQTQ